MKTILIVAGAVATAAVATFAPLWVTLTLGAVALAGLVAIILRADTLDEGLRKVHLRRGTGGALVVALLFLSP